KKGSNYEGGHRVACFVRWPNGNLGSPRSISTATQVQDLLPTFIDLLNLKLKNDTSFDGKSLKPILDQDKEGMEDRMIVVQYAGFEDFPVKYASSVIWNSWRLVGKDELYNLENDHGQKNKIASKFPLVRE